MIIFGILCPAFLFIAFAWGRNVPVESLLPGLIGMSLFFTCSATTPAVLPFETRTRTLERLLVAPVTIAMLIAGDVLGALIFGLALSLVPVVLGIAATGASLHHPLLLAGAIVLSGFSFAVLGSLFSAPATDNPSAVMTISNLARLPLVFISGVFVPVADLPAWARPIALLSPLTYTTELIRNAFGQRAFLTPAICLPMLAVFGWLLWAAALVAHRRNMPRRLSL